MGEHAFSLRDCAPEIQGLRLAIPAPVPECQAAITVRVSGRSAYIYMVKAARSIRGWITVTAAWFRRTAVRVFGFSRAHGAAGMRFNRALLVCNGGLRL